MGDNTLENVYLAFAVIATSASFWLYLKLDWWYPRPPSSARWMDVWFSRQSPAGPAPSFAEIDRTDLELWYHSGALEIQHYEQYRIAKGFDTVLGPLYYTDRHTSQVLESFAREAPTYLNSLIDWGAHDLSSFDYQIWGYIGNHETPLFCATLVFGLGAAWQLHKPLYGLILHHRPGVDFSIFKEVRRGGFAWERVSRGELDNAPLQEPITLHIPERKRPLHWSLDRYFPFATAFSIGLVLNIAAFVSLLALCC